MWYFTQVRIFKGITENVNRAKLEKSLPRLYTGHVQTQMWWDWNRPYHIPNESTNIRQQSCFPSQGQDTDD